MTQHILQKLQWEYYCLNVKDGIKVTKDNNCLCGYYSFGIIHTTQFNGYFICLHCISSFFFVIYHKSLWVSVGSLLRLFSSNGNHNMFSLYCFQKFHQVLVLFPSSQGLEVIWSSVVKIGQSLYREAPGKDPFRPDQKTPVKNFFLAGSYTKQVSLITLDPLN